MIELHSAEASPVPPNTGMSRQSEIVLCFVLAILSIPAQAQRRVSWDYSSLPVTIQVAIDVPLRPTGCQRGVLCAEGDLVIREGERFQMTEIGLEGGCTIEFRGSRFEPSSCAWLLGFSDAQSEIFIIVQVPGLGE